MRAVRVQAVLWLGYGVDSPGFESWQEKEILSSSKTIQVDSGAHLPSYLMGASVLSWK